MSDKTLLKKLASKYGESEHHYILQLYMGEAVRHKKDISERLFTVVKEILTQKEFRITAEDYTERLRAAKGEWEFSEEEVLAIDRAAALVLLRVLTEQIEKDKETRLAKAEAAAFTLRSLAMSDFEERYRTLSALENYLQKNDPIYPQCDKATRDDLKGRILAFAKKKKLDELTAAELYTKDATESPKSARKGWLFFASLYALSLVLTLACAFLGVPLLLLPLLFFPLTQLVKSIGDDVARRVLPSHPIPKLKLDTIPENGKTLVVITTLLVTEDNEPFQRLQRFYLANKDDNVRFGLLLDLADAGEETVERDRALIAFAEEKIATLNETYHDRFFLAIRKRSYSESERSFIGRERKRGALIDLVNYLRNEGNEFVSLHGDESFLKSAAYLITLDADTDLSMGAVKKMVGAMLHPDNRPIIEKGAVRRGYGILQPRMTVTAASASRSRFSLLMCGSGGTEPYASAAFDLYQNLFGEGIFCGKGIIDIDAFHTLIPSAFDRESVLSHDLIEGNLLRAGYLSDLTLTDSFPASPLAYFTRAHRWYRGDLQAMPYALESPRNAMGKRHKNPVGALGRYKLFDNLRRIFTPIATLLALVLSLFFKERAQLAVSFVIAASLILPVILSLFRAERALFRRYFSRILVSFAYRFMNLVFSLSVIAHQGLLAADALIRSLFRMLVSRRHLLLWTTAARADTKKNSAFAYLKATLPGMLAGILLLTFASTAPLRLFGILWILFPLFLVLLSHQFTKHPRPLSTHAKARLSRYVFDMWSYFAKYVTKEEHYLPPDNVQQLPVRAVAHRTSPTNIGMYLASCLAARDFGYITTDELLTRTQNTLETLEKLPKKFGHLYNWYDTKTLALLGEPFVSTVDSGNLVVALIALVEGLREYTEEEPAFRRIIYRYEKLIEETDFRKLYCEKRELFYIALSSDTPSYFSCYDLYMSEARATSYYAVAIGAVPKKHWEKLSRIVVGKGRYIGLASWSGTAFEYFMPHLFLPIPENSLTDEALAFAVSCQQKAAIKKLWGISESAYYAFDADMNYQYRAHGVMPLALDAGVSNAGAFKQRVLSPYSSFLMLATAPHAALANLDALKAFGAYGDHGFYEALDFSTAASGKDCAVIRSFMSHHVGMSIIAAANACFDNVFVKRFMRNPAMAAARELLEERIPAEAPLFRGKLSEKERPNVRRIAPPAEEKKLRAERVGDTLPKIVLLSNGTCSMKIAASGQVALAHRELAITYPAFAGRRESFRSSLRVVFSYKGKAYAAKPTLFSYSATKAVFTTSLDKLNIRTTFTLHGEKNLFAIAFSAAGTTQKIVPTLILEPILATSAAFFSHPFYRALSIECRFDKEDEILYFHARRREEEGEVFLALSCEGEGTLSFDSRKELLPFGYDEDDLNALAKKALPCRTGATISPLAVLRRDISPKMGKCSAEFLIAAGTTQKEVRDTILSSRQKNGSAAESIAETLRPVTRRMLRALGDDRPDLKYAELYLSALTFPQRSNVALPNDARLDSLWKFSLSGDLPIIAIEAKEDETDGGRRMISIFLKLHRLMREKGEKSDLVFLCRESDSYNRPISARIGREIAKEGESGYLSKRGGIFILTDPDAITLAAAMSCLYIPLDKDSSPEELYYRITGRRQKKPRKVITRPESDGIPPIPSDALRVSGGFFRNHSFTVIKNEVDTPRSFVYASRVFGTLVSAASPGYTWYLNAKECRLSEPADDLLCDKTHEIALAEKNGRLYDLAAISVSVEYSEGCAIYRGTLDGEPYTLKLGIDQRLPVKLILAELPKGAKLLYEVTPAFGAPSHIAALTQSWQEGETVFFQNPLSPHLHHRVIFLSPLHDEGEKQGYLFGIYPEKCDEVYHTIRTKYRDPDAIERGFLEYASHYQNLFSSLRFHLPNEALDVMMNHFVPYQTYVIRMLGRSGYHQSGGAFGFRDQLQDAIALLYYDAKITKQQIFRAAAHQYKEGDVQHWWHPFPDIHEESVGIRTRISDDLLWLPYAVTEYLRVTGDYEMLDAKIAYLDSPPLSEGENDRYEKAAKTAHKESVYHHCMRAIDASLKLSPRGLPLIGGGDWNDAFNRVGALGKGESIFLARFMQIVFTSFASVSEEVGDTASRDRLLDHARKLSRSVETHAWEENRYLRGSYDSGAPLGSQKSRACKIDILAQSFSAIAEGATDRTADAMREAFRILFDREHKLLKLFDPPFSAENKSAGYISAYCEGIRENGGQYNHGALFGARGYFAIGEKRKGYEILSAVNPCERSLHESTAKSYRAEPYALCGDIYTNPEHMGRGGWGLYTGAAGWFLRVTLEDLLGYREYADHFTLNPALSEKFPSFSLKLVRKDTTYQISAALGEREKIFLDGKNAENHFFFDGGTHILEIDIEKSEKL